MTAGTSTDIVLPEFEMTIDAARLQFFAKATGETASVYTDPAVAKQAGYPQLPVPPTFLFSVELECRDPLAWLAAIEVDPSRVLHGEQSFEYHSMVFAGDTVVARPRIVAYQEKTHALDVVVKDTDIVRKDGSAVAGLHSTYLILKDAP